MRSFTLHIPTRFVFGDDNLDRAGKEIRPLAKKVLVVCSSGSVVRTGILKRLIRSLEVNGIIADVYDQVMPNPRVSMVDKGGKLAADLKVEAVIGFGGGSAMDAAKGVAIVAANGGSIWDYVHTNGMANHSLPVIAIPTLSATGSEGNAFGVVTHDESAQKISFISPAVKPVLSIIDPKLTMSVPEDYFRDGVVDVIAHSIEAYISSKDYAPLNDRFSLALIKTAVEMGEKILLEPENSEYRGVFAWTAMMALNGINDAGREGPYPVHTLEHPLSGKYDLSHGRGLALLLPRYLRYFQEDKAEKIIAFGQAVFDSSIQNAGEALTAFESWLEKFQRRLTFQSLNIPQNDIPALTDMVFEMMANRKGNISGPRQMNRDDVTAIYLKCLT
ncbi:MAG TPA: iron-containing alcohol dehydrogenase [Candidatus Marinimicrobia bacterium]|nr:iron-containing alcohol dehydrogenase [Candidatus Neomarinimicrobiota bacterium]